MCASVAMTDIAAFYQTRQTDDFDDDRLSKVLHEAIAVKPATALDIGCGRGTLLRRLQQSCPACELFGVEISALSAAEAAASGVRVFAASIADGLPLPDGSMQLVIMGEVIEHLFDPDAALDEIKRVLAPGGTLILTTPNLASWSNRLLLLAGIQPFFTETSTRKKYGRVFAALGNRNPMVEGHLRIFTKRALVELIEDIGFRITRVRGACFDKMLGIAPAAPFERLFSNVTGLASNLIVVAEKPAV
jgi:SAM-dependent methyltransferase